MSYVIDERQGGPQAEINELRAQLKELTSAEYEALSEQREILVVRLKDIERTMATAAYRDVREVKRQLAAMTAERDAARCWARAWKAAAKANRDCFLLARIFLEANDSDATIDVAGIDDVPQLPGG